MRHVIKAARTGTMALARVGAGQTWGMLWSTKHTLQMAHGGREEPSGWLSVLAWLAQWMGNHWSSLGRKEQRVWGISQFGLGHDKLKIPMSHPRGNIKSSDICIWSSGERRGWRQKVERQKHIDSAVKSETSRITRCIWEMEKREGSEPREALSTLPHCLFLLQFINGGKIGKYVEYRG